MIEGKIVAIVKVKEYIHIFMNRGVKQGIQKGMYFNIRQPLKDPDTKELLDPCYRIIVGKAKVIAVFENMCSLTLLPEKYSIGDNICRGNEIIETVYKNIWNLI